MPLSQTRNVTGTDAGPSRPLNATFWPGVSKLPLLSRSHAYVRTVLSTSDPLPFNVMLEPSSTVYGPPALAVGGSLTGTTLTITEPLRFRAGSPAEPPYSTTYPRTA